MIYLSKTDKKLAIAAANAITILNYAEINLNNLDFSDVDISGANLNQAFLNNTKFCRANLQNVSFKSAWLGNVNFDGANMEGVEFGERAHLQL